MITWKNLGVDDATKQHLIVKPALHQLCIGDFLKGPIQIAEGIVAVSLQPIGSDDQIEFMDKYARELLGANFHPERVIEAKLKCLIDRPVISLICTPVVNGTPEQVLSSVELELTLARQVLSSVYVCPVVPFANFFNMDASTSFYQVVKPRPIPGRNRILSIKELETPDLLARIFNKAKDDEVYSFALALFSDAVIEPNPRFRIARLFNVLACLAAENKSELPERKAVRYLLGLSVAEDIQEWEINGEIYHFDIVELAGRLRNKLFHGAAFSPNDLTVKVRPAFALLENSPMFIADILTEYCKTGLYNYIIDNECLNDCTP